MTQTEEPVNVNATKKTGKNVTMEDIMQEIIKLCEQYPQVRPKTNVLDIHSL